MVFLPWRPQASKSSPPSTSQTSQITRTPEPCLHPPYQQLTESQRRMYQLEKEENFRWTARLLSSPSSHVLTSSSIVPTSTQNEIADIGQYAELAHGCFDPEFVWRNLRRLVSEGYPLEGYGALLGSNLVSVFRGDVAKLQGYIAYRPESRQLVIALSGTSTPLQALHDVDSWMVPYPTTRPRTPGGNTNASREICKVHRGFWRMFQGIRQIALDNLHKALNTLDVTELVLTGHSLGAAQASLLVTELLRNGLDPIEDIRPRLTQGLVIKLVGFGSPRVGNEALARFYRRLISDYREAHGKDRFQEYMVKGYNDGVPCFPLKATGYRHLCDAPLYLFHGRLFHIPPSECEHSVFPVQLGDETQPPDYPLGGHNYYNNRDMEKLQRRMRSLKLLVFGDVGWEERYLRYLSNESGGNAQSQRES